MIWNTDLVDQQADLDVSRKKAEDEFSVDDVVNGVLSVTISF